MNPLQVIADFPGAQTRRPRHAMHGGVFIWRRSKWQFAPPQYCRVLQSGNAERLAQLFLDACRLAATLTEVVQLGLTDVTTTLDVDSGNLRAVSLEGTLDAHTVGDLAYREGRVVFLRDSSKVLSY